MYYFTTAQPDGDVSIRFNGKDDNIMLELHLKKSNKTLMVVTKYGDVSLLLSK